MAEQRVVDTNVVSLSLKEPATSDALAYEPHLVGYELVISFVTLVELLSWPIVRGWGQPRARRLEAYIFDHFAIYYADEALCRRWVRLRADLRSVRSNLGMNRAWIGGDSWVAATALELGVPLITHNRRHFEAVPGLIVISEAP